MGNMRIGKVPICRTGPYDDDHYIIYTVNEIDIQAFEAKFKLYIPIDY